MLLLCWDKFVDYTQALPTKKACSVHCIVLAYTYQKGGGVKKRSQKKRRGRLGILVPVVSVQWRTIGFEGLFFPIMSFHL